jgi:hypothetical protein
MVTPEERVLESRERVVIQATQPGVVVAGRHVSWSGVWSGFLVALGTLVLLTALGIAIGSTVVDVDPATAAAPRGWGIGAGLWELLSIIVSLFVGGMVAGRFGAVAVAGTASTGAVEGMLVWVLSILAIMVFGGAGIAGLTLGPGLGLNRAAQAGEVAGAPPSAAAPNLTAAIDGGNVDQMLAALDDPRTADRIASATGEARATVASRLADIRARVEASRADPARAKSEAQQGLSQLGSSAGTASGGAPSESPVPGGWITGWATFGALLLSLLAAMGGATAGSRRAAVVV